MDGFSIAAASGMRSRLESLDMLANNLANARTAGYKSDREFYSVYLGEEAALSAEENGDVSPMVLPVIQTHYTDFTQGALEPGGSPYDLALTGPGFFAVEGPNGTLFTRNGAFRISEEGKLVTTEGYPVRLQGGGTLDVPTGTDLAINPEGEVSQDGLVLGRLELVEFANPRSIDKQGSSYYRIVEEGVTPQPAAGARVNQGMLETSNVGAAESSVRLIHIMRQFEMLQKALLQNKETGRRAIEQLASTG